MENVLQFDIQILDFKDYKDEILSLRSYCWSLYHKDLNTVAFYTEKEAKEDESSMHCGIFNKGKLIAVQRLLFIGSIEVLPYPDFFQFNSVGEKLNKLSYKDDKEQVITVQLPAAATGRLVIHPDFQNKGISKLILTFLIDYAKKHKIKTLLSFPASWMLNMLYSLGFICVKKRKGVFKPMPELDVFMLKKELC